MCQKADWKSKHKVQCGTMKQTSDWNEANQGDDFFGSSEGESPNDEEGDQRKKEKNGSGALGTSQRMAVAQQQQKQQQQQQQRILDT